MPTPDERLLGERLLDAADRVEACMAEGQIGDWGEEASDLREAAHIIALWEQPQPEAAELLARAEWLDGNPDDPRYSGPSAYAAELRAYAAALVRLDAAEAKLARYKKAHEEATAAIIQANKAVAAKDDLLAASEATLAAVREVLSGLRCEKLTTDEAVKYALDQRKQRLLGRRDQIEDTTHELTAALGDRAQGGEKGGPE